MQNKFSRPEDAENCRRAAEGMPLVPPDRIDELLAAQAVRIAVLEELLNDANDERGKFMRAYASLKKRVRSALEAGDE